MAFSGPLRGFIFAYFLIIATCSVPRATAVVFNLPQTCPHNGSYTQGFELVSSVSTSMWPGSQSQCVVPLQPDTRLSDVFYRESEQIASFNTSYFWKECAGDTNLPFPPNLSTFSVVVITALIFGIYIILVFLLRLFLLWKRKRTHDENQIVEERSTDLFESGSPRPFTFEELSQATDNFHRDRLLGEGGFGAVYIGSLSSGTNVAVKRVSNTSEQGIKEYKAEVTIVSRSNHRHLVQLIGWCHEREGEFLLVYELMSNRSLDVHLFSLEMPPLAWEIRYKIAQSLARALRYLHDECAQHSVLHRDIKSSNVLLDCDFEAKLGDFGLAKLVDHDKSVEISVLAGTRGYLAPECFLTGKVSWQSDVYSYGVVTLELATGRRTIDCHAQEDQKILVRWVQNLYKMGRILEAVDPKLGDGYNNLQMEALILIGLWCVHHEFHERPSMSEIVHVLDAHDPVSDLHEKIQRIFHDLAPQNTEWVHETEDTSSEITLYFETETSSPVDPEREENANSPIFIWRHISIPHPLRYLIEKIWSRP